MIELLPPIPCELSQFIANSRLHASIDKVRGIVETTYPSLKNAHSTRLVKRGDVLLNLVQRSRCFISVRLWYSVAIDSDGERLALRLNTDTELLIDSSYG